MRRHLGLSLVLSGLVLWAVSAPVAAAASTTYHGVFGGEVKYVDCDPTPDPLPTATGNWNVSLHGTTDATVTVNIFTDGAHHVSFGGVAPQVKPQNGETFILRPIKTMAGYLTISLKDGVLTYDIPEYTLPNITSCSDTGGVTYFGSLGR